MITLLIAVGSFVGFIVAYHTYGKWLSKRIFGLDPEAEVPSKQLRDDIDFVPTKRDHIYAAAQKVNVFGGKKPLDPLQGDPYM